MAFFERRPLCVWSLLFALFVPIGFFIAADVRLFLMVAAVVLILAAVVLRLGYVISAKCLRGALALGICLFLAFGEVGLWSHFHMTCPESVTAGRGAVQLEAVVTERQFSSSYESRFVIRTGTVDGEACDCRAMLVVPGECDLQPGYRFSAEASLGEFSDEGVWREDLNALSGGVVLKWEVSDVGLIRITDEAVPVPGLGLRRLNERLSARLQVALGRDTGRLAGALLLGRRGDLDDAVTRDFSRAGVSHLLALSGLHVSILIGCLDWLLTRLYCPRKARLVLLFAAAVGYLLLTGVSLSALRCVVMLGLYYLSFFIGADQDPPTTLCAALALILLASPTSALDVSLAMSFCATFVILVSAPVQAFLQRRIIVRHHGGGLLWLTTALCAVCRALVTSVAALIGVLPITWLAFGQLAPAAPLMTLLLLPATYLLLIGSVLILLFGAPLFGGALVPGLARVLSPVGRFMLRATAGVSGLRDMVISLRYDFVPWILLPLAAWLVVCLMIRVKRKVFLWIPPLCALLAFGVALTIFSATGKGKIDMTVLSQGDSETILLSDADAAMILDLSDGNYSRFADAIERAEADAHTEIEVILLTHLHRRHITGLQKVFEKAIVRELWLPTPTSDEEYYWMKSIVEAAGRAGVDVCVYEPGDELTVFGTGRVTLVDRGFMKRSTQPLELLRMELAGTSIAYIGRAATESQSPLAGEARALASECEILWLGRHGPLAKEPLELSLDGVPEVWADAEAVWNWTPGTLASLADEAEVILLSPGQPFARRFIPDDP